MSTGNRLLYIIFAIVLIVIIIIITIAVLTVIQDRQRTHPEFDEADVIIIGAGTAGCVMARRLHERNRNLKIVMLERGVDRSNDRNVYNIANAITAGFFPPYSEVIPTDFPGTAASFALMYGGASSHNFALAVRGSPEFYDTLWKPELGLGFEELIPIFKRIEKYNGEPNNKTQSPELRGENGLLRISQLPERLDIGSILGPIIGRTFHLGSVDGSRMIQQALTVAKNVGGLRATDEFANPLMNAVRKLTGAPIVEDYNVDIGACVSKKPQLFVDAVTGLRSSLNVAYLSRCFRETDSKNSLNVVFNADVEKILMERKNAEGVQWKDQIGITHITPLKPKGKVILCGGGVYSPVILQRSGFANPKIGANLTTHFGCTMIMSVINKTDFSTGPVGFIPRVPGEKTRDYQLVVGGETLVNFGLIPDVDVDKIKEEEPDRKFFTFLLWTLKPRSRGEVIASKDKIDIISGIYEDGDLSDPDSDISKIVDGLRFLYDLVEEMRLELPSLEVHYPPEEVLIDDDENELEEFARDGISVTDHWSGTCPVGDVLQDDFRLKETKNVHVVDASSFPGISDANTQYPVVVIAEIAADRILL